MRAIAPGALVGLPGLDADDPVLDVVDPGRRRGHRPRFMVPATMSSGWAGRWPSSATGTRARTDTTSVLGLAGASRGGGPVVGLWGARPPGSSRRRPRWLGPRGSRRSSTGTSRGTRNCGGRALRRTWISSSRLRFHSRTGAMTVELRGRAAADRHVEADLVVALPGAAVRDRSAPTVRATSARAGRSADGRGPSTAGRRPGRGRSPAGRGGRGTGRRTSAWRRRRRPRGRRAPGRGRDRVRAEVALLADVDGEGGDVEAWYLSRSSRGSATEVSRPPE